MKVFFSTIEFDIVCNHEVMSFVSDLCGAAQRLQRVWDNVLGTHDPELYNHLNMNFVLPTTFGTNWTKLLFSRQFKGYVLVWDAVIASGFALVDFLVVAMVRQTEHLYDTYVCKRIELQLIAIRRVLLAGDSNLCNQLLVSKYPDSVDVRYVISLALHIHEPLKYNRPGGSSFKVGTMWMQDVTSRKGRAAGPGGSRRENGNSMSSSGNGAVADPYSISANRIPRGGVITNVHSETKMVNVGDRKAPSGAEVAVSNNGLPVYVVSSTPDNGFEVLGRELPQSSASASDRMRLRLLRDQRQEFLANADSWVGKLSAVSRILEGREPNVGQARRCVAEVRDLIRDVVNTARNDDEEEEDDEELESRVPDRLRLDASVAYDVLDEWETSQMQ